MFNNKIAQISMFIIIAMIISFIFIFLVSTNTNFKKSNLDTYKQIPDDSLSSSVEFYVENCLEVNTYRALLFPLMQNGYYMRGTAGNFPNVSILMYIDFYEMDTRISEFSTRTIDNAVLLYLYDTMPYCIAEMSDIFLDYNITSNNTTFEIKVTKLNQSIIVNLKYPIIITTNSGVSRLEDFSYTLDRIPFSLMENDVNLILNSLFEDIQNYDPQNQTNISLDISKKNFEKIISRDDVSIIVIKENERENKKENENIDYDVILNYGGQWTDSTVFFKIRDETLEGVDLNGVFEK